MLKGRDVELPSSTLALLRCAVLASVFALDLLIPSNAVMAGLYLLALLIAVQRAPSSQLLPLACVAALLALLGAPGASGVSAERLALVLCLGLCALVMRAEAQRRERLQRGWRALKQKEEAFRNLLSSTHEAVIVSDTDGVIQGWNRAAEQLLEWPASEIIGRSLSLIVPDRNQQFCADSLRRFEDLHQNRVVSEETALPVVSRSGREITVELSVCCWELGGTRYLCTIARDVSPLQESGRKIEELTRSLELKGREAEQFVYAASHDLKEPLRTISSIIERLDSRYCHLFDDEAREYMEMVTDSTQRMASLIRALLDFSSIGDHREWRPIDGNMLLRGILLDLDLAIRESGAQVTVGELPVVYALETELRLILQNLLSNAIKFRREGVPPRVQVAAANQDGQWVFSIVDNGIGIDAKYSAKIFEMFQRVHHRSRYEGNGIGLAFCKKIAALHSGRIWFERNVEGGSTFYLSIPDKSAAPAPRVEPIPLAEPQQATDVKCGASGIEALLARDYRRGGASGSIGSRIHSASLQGKH